MNNNNLEINVKNNYNDNNSITNNSMINNSIIKIYEILGDDFELIEIDTNYDEIKNNKMCNFKFVNKSELKNLEKSKYISNKIKLLKSNNFNEVEDIKISGVGRFIRICLKSIQDYENEKILLLKDFIEKINFIDEKIKILKKK